MVLNLVDPEIEAKEQERRNAYIDAAITAIRSAQGHVCITLQSTGEFGMHMLQGGISDVAFIGAIETAKVHMIVHNLRKMEVKE